ncbi:hypothetical protein [Roseibium sp.]|uniref:hypothetical protein n=1 Tax=Roseibium sp. TaxID=1936156 RepID=UPI0039F0EDC3
MIFKLFLFVVGSSLSLIDISQYFRPFSITYLLIATGLNPLAAMAAAGLVYAALITYFQSIVEKRKPKLKIALVVVSCLVIMADLTMCSKPVSVAYFLHVAGLPALAAYGVAVLLYLLLVRLIDGQIEKRWS